MRRWRRILGEGGDALDVGERIFGYHVGGKLSNPQISVETLGAR